MTISYLNHAKYYHSEEPLPAYTAITWHNKMTKC